MAAKKPNPFAKKGQDAMDAEMAGKGGKMPMMGGKAGKAPPFGKKSKK